MLHANAFYQKKQVFAITLLSRMIPFERNYRSEGEQDDKPNIGFVSQVMEKGAKCSKRGSTNTDRENGIWRCYECDHEW